MRRKEIVQLIEEGESLICEFKLKFSSHDKIAKGLTAFANTKGGVMIFGVDDSKAIAGVASEKEETELINETAKIYCEPPVEIFFHYFSIENKEIVVVEIPESKTKPHRIQDFQEFDINNSIVYLRVNDKSVQASKEMIRVLRSSSNNKVLEKYFIGDLEKIVFTLFQQNEIISVKQFCAVANISERRASRTLVKMVRAGLLFIHTKDNGEVYFTSLG
ncbi:MAG: ATP-binding protein [Chlorobiaceae bacterium]|nr:ATP-binding protein [Chlorobiaceae bacterium]MBA4309462.1 ATP-binding protein [Chlorobiaceae bacterium]